MKRLASYKSAGRKAYAFWGVIGAIASMVTHIAFGPVVGSKVDETLKAVTPIIVPNPVNP